MLRPVRAAPLKHEPEPDSTLKREQKSKATHFSGVGGEGGDFTLDRVIAGVLQAAERPRVRLSPRCPPEGKTERLPSEKLVRTEFCC